MNDSIPWARCPDGQIQQLLEQFVNALPGGDQENEVFAQAKQCLRPPIFRSWVHSKRSGVDPFSVKDRTLLPKKLQQVLEVNKNLLSVALPYMEKLIAFIESSHFTALIADADGYILSMSGGEGDQMQDYMRRTHMVVGADRSEEYAGTNGIGTCLREKEPVQVWALEHYAQMHQIYASFACPIRNTAGDIIGCVDIVGPQDKSHIHTLGMAIAAVDGIEKELHLRAASERYATINQQLSSTLQFLTSGVIMIDSEGIITQVNQRTEKILHLSARQIAGQPIDGVLQMESANLDLLRLPENIYNREVSVRLRDSAPVRLSLSVSIIRNESHARTGAVIILEEITHVRKMVNQMSGFTARYTADSIVGASSQIRTLKQFIGIAAKSLSNVLILGESGTGKELIAQAIHNASDRAKGPFIPINCASIPKTLIESEFFGYEGSAFTGADKNGRPGKFELAEGGTIFLDEIGDMPLDVQAALLRVIQSREIVRIGGKISTPVDVRIIAATNRNLEQAIDNNSFRRDLYYRLNVLSIQTSSLRERKSDIELLANHFLTQCGSRLNSNVRKVSSEVLTLFLRYDWPGNVRELENVIERAVNVAQEDTITTVDLPNDTLLKMLQNGNLSVPATPQPGSIFGGSTYAPAMARKSALPMKEAERRAIEDALEWTAGNIKRASACLGISRRTLYKRLEEFQIDIGRFRRL